MALSRTNFMVGITVTNFWKTYQTQRFKKLKKQTIAYKVYNL